MEGASRFVALVLAVALAAVALPAEAVTVAAGDPVDVERMILDAVNDRRVAHGLRPYVLHAGLRDEARDHARDLARRRTLDHRGFEGRLAGAAPDPYEPSGGSDDGIWGAWTYGCENAAYRFRAGSSTEPIGQVAKGIEASWFASAGHRACELDQWGYSLNVAGVGIHRDAGGVWWAVMDVAYDSSPPAASRPCAADAPKASVNLCG